MLLAPEAVKRNQLRRHMFTTVPMSGPVQVSEDGPDYRSRVAEAEASHLAAIETMSPAELRRENAELRERNAELEREVSSWKFNRDTWKEAEQRAREAEQEAKAELRKEQGHANRQALPRIHEWLKHEFDEHKVPSKYRREGARLVIDKIAELVEKYQVKDES
jgi:hypothetical protein